MSRSIEQFREECAKLKSKIDENENRWKLLFNGQKIYGDIYKPRRALITLSKLCPNCNTKLKKDMEFSDSKYFYTIYTCQCGYEYARKIDKKSMDEVSE